MILEPASLGPRITIAGQRVISDRRLLWGLAALFAARRLIAELPVWVPDTADVYQFIGLGHRALTDPGSIYPSVANQIAHGYFFSGLYPPPQILLGAAYALAPDTLGPTLWVATNLAAAVVALVLLLRMLAMFHPAAQPAFWIVVFCFTPLFEDLRLGQRGGVLMMLAIVAMARVRTQPVLAGALGGVATSLKFFPGALIFGVEPRRQWKFVASLIVSSTSILAVSFIPFGSPIFYLIKVLIPSITWQNSGAHDCFQNSTPLLFARVVGGEPFTVGDPQGAWHSVTFVPWQFPTLATLLTLATLVGILACTFGAVWRSDFAQPYSLAICFSLGTLLPGEVFTYQFLPMLPLLLVVFMQLVRHKKLGSLLVLGVALWILIASPCALPLPSLWTVAALAIFAVAVFNAPLFRRDSSRAAA